MAIHRPSRTTFGAVALGLTAAIALSGCGTPPWAQDGAVEPSVTPTPTMTAPAEVVTVINELANGSATHQVTAGNIVLDIVYYSELGMDKWTADATKPLSISLSADLASGDKGQRIYLSQVNVASTVTAADGSTLPAPPASNDASKLTPGYFIKDPQSYGQTVLLPALDPAATAITLSITYELLLQTTPTSKDYAKQTANDTLTIAIAQPLG